MKHTKKELSFAVKNFKFFFEKLNESLPSFQKIYASKFVENTGLEFSSDNEENIYNNIRILYLRSVNEFRMLEIMYGENNNLPYGKDPTPELLDGTKVEALLAVGQMIIHYEQTSLGNEGFDEF